MTPIDILKSIHTHQIAGVMLHNNMMTAYDFLGFKSFKRLHEYRMFCELVDADCVTRYAINHHNRLIPDEHPTSSFIVPVEWASVDRLTISNENRRKYLKQMMEKWIGWERSTKELLQRCYKDLCDIGEIATAKKICHLLGNVDFELKKAERLYIKLTKIDFDLKSIVACEDEMHDHYSKKTKKLGIKTW